MTSRRLPILLATLAVAALGACSSTSGTRSSSGYASGMAEPDTAVVLLPTVGAAEQMRAGCWASFYDERNFIGDSLTLIGPVELQTLGPGQRAPAEARHQERRHWAAGDTRRVREADALGALGRLPAQHARSRPGREARLRRPDRIDANDLQLTSSWRALAERRRPSRRTPTIAPDRRTPPLARQSCAATPTSAFSPMACIAASTGVRTASQPARRLAGGRGAPSELSCGSGVRWRWQQPVPGGAHRNASAQVVTATFGGSRLAQLIDGRRKRHDIEASRSTRYRLRGCS